MSHVTHMNGSRHNYECGMSHIQMHLWQDSFICHELYHLSRTKLISNAACHINKCSMSCTWIRYVAHVTRLIHMSRTLSSITNETHIIWYFLYVNSICRACDKTHSYVTNSIIYHERNSYHIVCHVREFDMSRMWQDSFICHELYHLSRTKLISYGISCTWIRHVAHTNESCHRYAKYTHVYYLNISVFTHTCIIWYICIMYTSTLWSNFHELYHQSRTNFMIYLYYVHMCITSWGNALSLFV